MADNDTPDPMTTDVQGRTLISRREAADIAGVHIRTIDFWRRTGKLRTYRERNYHPRFDKAELEQFLATSPEPPASASA